MKNLFITVAAVVALTFTLASCAKDRTCTCTGEGFTSKVEYKKVTKSQADCVSYTEIDSDGENYAVTCTLD